MHNPNPYLKLNPCTPHQDTFDIRICLSRSVKHTVNFETAHESDLHTISIPVSFSLLQSGTIHGLAFWFDVAFLGSQLVGAGGRVFGLCGGDGGVGFFELC